MFPVVHSHGTLTNTYVSGFSMHRVHSRAALIHFLEPRVRPCYDEDDKVYEELETSSVMESFQTQQDGRLDLEGNKERLLQDQGRPDQEPAEGKRGG